MSSGPVQPSRTMKDLRPHEAAVFIETARRSLEDAAALTAGWSRRQLIDVALTIATATTKPHVLKQHRTIDENAWTDADVRAAHSAWYAGDRTQWAEDGERLYHRWRKRRLVASRRAS